MSRLAYASQPCWGLMDEGEKKQLGAFITKAVRHVFLPPDQSTFPVICDATDVSLFQFILQNVDHVLHKILPPV